MPLECGGDSAIHENPNKAHVTQEMSLKDEASFLDKNVRNMGVPEAGHSQEKVSPRERVGHVEGWGVEAIGGWEVCFSWCRGSEEVCKRLG